MKAIVKPDSALAVITSCGGAEFLKLEYRPVPVGCEDEALNNPFLDVAEDDPPEFSPSPEIIPALVPPFDDGEIDATDGALTLADEYGVDLSNVEGSGVEGRIIKADVVMYVDASRPEEE